MSVVAQVANRRPIITKARIRSLNSSCVIYGGQSGTGAGSSSTISVSPVSIIPPVPHNYLYLNISLNIAKGEGWKYRENGENPAIAFYASKFSCENHIHHSKGLLEPIIFRVADMDALGSLKGHVKAKHYFTPDRLQRLDS